MTKNLTECVVILLVAVSVVVALLWGDLFVSSSRAAEAQGVGIIQGLQLDQPDFTEAFADTLWVVATSPRTQLGILEGPAFYSLIGSVLLVLWIWFKTDLPTKARGLSGSLSTLPVLVGLGWGPVLIRDTFAALAAQGLSAPGIVGIGVGESFTPALSGAELGIVLLGVFTFASHFAAVDECKDAS